MVRDSDGSAFVTKAEFDALKNSFQEQVNNYNTSIDSKIDGAIASYLSSLKISKSESVKVVYADWDTVECVNTELKNELEIPTLNIQVMYHSMNHGGDNWDDIWFIKFDGNNVNTSIGSKINVIEGITVNNSTKSVDTTNAYWCGTSQDVRNEITFKGLWNVQEHTSAGNPDNKNFKFQCNRFSKWRWYNDWHTTFNDKTNPIFKPMMWRYGHNPGASAYVWYPVRANNYDTATEMLEMTSVVEKAEVSYDLNNTKHTHILSWTKDRTFEAINSQLNCYNKVSANQSLTSADVIKTGTLTWNNWADIYWFARNSSYLMKRDCAMEMKDTEGKPSAATDIKQKIPTIGLLPTDLKASEIYQWDTNLKKGDSKNPIEKIRLYEGMPLVYLKTDEQVVWQPKFDLIFDNIADKVDELYIEAGYVSFGDKNSNSEKIDLDPTSSETRIKTTAKIGDVRFTAEKDGYIWVKWYPAYTNASDVDNKGWIATLNLSYNSSVTVIKPQ